MTDAGSVTGWIDHLKNGDQQAAQKIWERFHRQLVSLARKKLAAGERREADEEDVVQNAFHSFYRAASEDRFPQLEDRDNLWRLLVTITARKAVDQIHRERAKKRGGGTVLTESRIYPIDRDSGDNALQEVVGDEILPAFAAEFVEQFDNRLAVLGEESLRQTALLKMEGHTNVEIAKKLRCSVRTVARKLDTIRIIWQKEPLT